MLFRVESISILVDLSQGVHDECANAGTKICFAGIARVLVSSNFLFGGNHQWLHVLETSTRQNNRGR
jgi:hypothetical protein